MLWLAALSVCARVCVRVKERERVRVCASLSLVPLRARTTETTPTRLDSAETLTNHGTCHDRTRDLLHARAECDITAVLTDN